MLKGKTKVLLLMWQAITADSEVNFRVKSALQTHFANRTTSEGGNIPVGQLFILVHPLQRRQRVVP